jgi:hypothetical protein
VVPGSVGINHRAVKASCSVREEMLHIRMTLVFHATKVSRSACGEVLASAWFALQSPSSTPSCSVEVLPLLALSLPPPILARSDLVANFQMHSPLGIPPLSACISVLRISWLPVYLWAIMSNRWRSVSAGSPACGEE